MSEEKAASYVPQIKAAYGALLASHKKNLAHALTLGSLLNDAKTALGKKGKWTEWLAEYCPQISHRTANVYMKLAKHKDKFTDETNSQRAAIKALDGDFGVGGAVSIVNAEDEKKDDEPTNEEEPDDEPTSCDVESGEMIPTGVSPDDLSALLQNLAVDELCTALIDAWDELHIIELCNRLHAHFKPKDLSIQTPLKRAPPAPPPQPN
jgi:hypothetical protein